MSPRAQNAIAIAAVVVAGAGLAGIAVIEGWWTPALPAVVTPASVASPAQSFVGTAPLESLSPGESVVTPEAPKPAPSPAASPPLPKPPPAAKADAGKPAKQAQAPPVPDKRRVRGTCPNCGIVSSTTHRPSEAQRGGAWEVRVKFDDGTRATLRFPTDPGFRVGERVVFTGGRLHRD